MKYTAMLFTIGVAGLFVAALVLVATFGGEEEESPATTATPQATASAAPTTSEQPSPTADPLAGVCAENPDPTTDDLNRVDVPIAGDSITSPVTVSGQIAAFEATFRIRIFGADGTQIADQFGMSEEGQVVSTFSEDVAFSVNEETPACIWVHAASAEDGSAVNVVQIPVILEPPASVCLPNPDPATADVNEVDTPLSGASITSPVTVSGEIVAFEAVFRVTIFDANGLMIADQPGLSAEGQVLSFFSEDVVFSVTEQTPACLWVYANSARDGNPIDVVQIPVTLEP